MNRQYIGARYVPKIEGEWSSNKTYEGLVIVTYNGDSYTSKKAVPLGVAITDERYWVLTSKFNAQLEHYREEVQTMEQEKETYPVRKNYYRVYVNADTGYDENAGTSDAPVETLERAIEIGLRTSSEFRVYFQVAGDYTFPYITINGCTIHFVGVAGTKVQFTSNTAIYNCHINMQNIEVDSDSGWYVDNTFTLLNNCVFKCGYTHNGGSFQANNCEFSNVTLNFCLGWFVDTVFNDITHTTKTTSIELKTSYIRVAGVFKTNYTMNVSTFATLLNSTLLLSSGLSHDGREPANTIEVNNSIVRGTKVRTELLANPIISNGGRIENEYYDLADTTFNKRYNELILPVYITSNGVARIGFYEKDLYPFSNWTCTIHSMFLFMNTSGIEITPESVTVTPHSSNVVIDISGVGDYAIGSVGVCRISFTLNGTV